MSDEIRFLIRVRRIGEMGDFWLARPNGTVNERAASMRFSMTRDVRQAYAMPRSLARAIQDRKSGATMVAEYVIAARG